MKRILLLLAAVAVSFTSKAQTTYQALTVNGYTADVVANGVGTASETTNVSVDNANFAFLSNDWSLTDGGTTYSYGLPSDGYIESTAIPGLSFQFASFSDNNSLRLHDQDESGTLSFTEQVMATKVFVMATSGSGNATLNATIEFSDGSTQDFTSLAVPDWFYSTAQPVIASGFGRINLANDAVENPSGNPRLYQISMAVLAENQAKTITNITFYKSSSAEGVINIMGVSAALLPSCPTPSDLAATTTDNSATVTFSPAVITPTGGYDYYYSTDDTTPSAAQIPSGNVSNATGTITINNLQIGLTYYFWIRSHCSTSDQSAWVPYQFTTGQVTVIGIDSDIATNYESSTTVSANSTTDCPGIMVVQVPAGFEIASIGTQYQMQTASNGWMSEQRSLLVCNTSGNAETTLTQGVGSSTGTYSYSRSGLDIANGLTGEVEFELRAWRTYGGSGCNMDYNRVIGSTWGITITYTPSLSTTSFDAKSIKMYPNPAHDQLTVSSPVAIRQIKVISLTGQELMSKQDVQAGEYNLPISGLASGIYLVKVVTDKGVKTERILKD